MYYKKLLLFILVFIFSLSLFIDRAVASTPLYGWAWSSNIGWISFNSANTTSGSGGTYSVYVSTSTSPATIGGYAWSSNIGWISFNPSDTVGCPIGNCSPNMDLSTGYITGWARAISAIGRTDGWDGWIQLSGQNHETYTGSGVTLSTTTGNIYGYAWGADVIGWLGFTSVYCPGCANAGGDNNNDTDLCTNIEGIQTSMPNGYNDDNNDGICTPITSNNNASCNISVSPNSLISAGGIATISWTTSNAVSCSLTSSLISSNSVNIPTGSLTVNVDPNSDTNNKQYTVSMICANDASINSTCTNNINVSGTGNNTSPSAKLYFNGIPTLYEKKIKTSGRVTVNWQISDGVTGCSEKSEPNNLNQWKSMEHSGTSNKVINGRPTPLRAGNYELSLDNCKDAANNTVQSNTIKLYITDDPSQIQEH